VRTDHPYRGRTAALGTRHGKERQLAVPLAGMVGITVHAVESDTDALGTFTGEVPRTMSMRDAAIAKARAAMAATGCTLGLGSEGTIGPDPALPLLTSDRELIALVDAERDAIQVACVRDFGVIVVAARMQAADDPEPFLERAGFPRHRLVARPEGIEPVLLPQELVHKGIGDRELLRAAVAVCSEASPSGRALVESDLRAHCCPSRQAVITRCAWELGHRLAARCPACRAPGWGVTEPTRGLPCEICGTWLGHAVRGRVLGCAPCGHRIDVDQDRRNADPSTCPTCNP